VLIKTVVSESEEDDVTDIDKDIIEKEDDTVVSDGNSSKEKGDESLFAEEDNVNSEGSKDNVSAGVDKNQDTYVLNVDDMDYDDESIRRRLT